MFFKGCKKENNEIKADDEIKEEEKKIETNSKLVFKKLYTTIDKDDMKEYKHKIANNLKEYCKYYNYIYNNNSFMSSYYTHSMPYTTKVCEDSIKDKFVKNDDNMFDIINIDTLKQFNDKEIYEIELVFNIIFEEEEGWDGYNPFLIKKYGIEFYSYNKTLSVKDLYSEYKDNFQDSFIRTEELFNEFIRTNLSYNDFKVLKINEKLRELNFSDAFIKVYLPKINSINELDIVEALCNECESRDMMMYLLLNADKEK